MNVTLGINTCFALKRWPRPADWASVVRNDLGLEFVELSLDLIDSTISWPAGVHDALVTALSGAMFRPGDLAGLDPDEQLVVARRLLREGVVVPVESDSAAGD